MNKTLKRKAAIAAGAATVLALAAATPSFAHMRDGMNDSSATTKVAHAHATVAATITAVPTTITDVREAARGAKFVAYKLDAAATELPATQPTTPQAHAAPCGNARAAAAAPTSRCAPSRR